MKFSIRAVTTFEIHTEDNRVEYHAATISEDLKGLKGVELFLEGLGYTKGYTADVVEQIEKAIKRLEEEE
jgi:hypothetical protein